MTRVAAGSDFVAITNTRDQNEHRRRLSCFIIGCLQESQWKIQNPLNVVQKCHQKSLGILIVTVTETNRSIVGLYFTCPKII